MNELCKGDLSNMNGKVPFDAAEQNDAAGIKVVNDYIIYLGETITNYVNIFRQWLRKLLFLIAYTP